MSVRTVLSESSDYESDSSQREMRIDITSDVICPFCLIGIGQLLNAISLYNDAHPSLAIQPIVRIMPYELQPGMSTEPVKRMTLRRRKFGNRAEEIGERMRGKLREAGYETPLNGLTSSSHLAQRLCAYALSHHSSAQLPLYMSMLEAYHVDGKHPSDLNLLASLAVKHGIFEDENSARMWLEGDEMDNEVKMGYSQARRLGVTGVPFFVFAGKYAVSGAVGEREFANLLEEVIRRESGGSISPSPTSTAVSPTEYHQPSKGVKEA